MREINGTPTCACCSKNIHLGIMYLIKGSDEKVYICQSCYGYTEKVFVNHKPGDKPNIIFKTDYPPVTLWNQWCGNCNKYTYFNSGGCTEHTVKPERAK